jgi:WhiB family redox-sensing transcriptional regulator
MNRVMTDPGRVWQRDFGTPLPHVTAPVSTIRELDSIRWRLHGRCADDTTGAWFEDRRTVAARRARRVCADCPVRAACLSAALLFGEEFGIWGGLDPQQRERLDARLHRGETLIAVVEAALGLHREVLDEAV